MQICQDLLKFLIGLYLSRTFVFFFPCFHFCLFSLFSRHCVTNKDHQITFMSTWNKTIAWCERSGILNRLIRYDSNVENRKAADKIFTCSISLADRITEVDSRGGVFFVSSKRRRRSWQKNTPRQTASAVDWTNPLWAAGQSLPSASIKSRPLEGRVST